MSLNYEADKTYHQFDSAGMLVVKDDPESWKDSIGRTVLAWIAYGKPEELKESVNDCTVFGNPWNLLRHPNHPEEFASRDHFSYWIILQKLTNSDYGFKKTIACLPRMCGMNLWMKSLSGNRTSEFLYYLVYTLGAHFGNWWLKLLRKIGNIKPERDNEWWIERHMFDVYNSFESEQWNKEHMITNGWEVQKFRTPWQKLWAWIIFQTIPAYPLHNKGWQLYVMPESRRKEKLKKILLSRIGISNIMLRLLFGDLEITENDIQNYPAMTGFRPGVYLDETCRRDIRKLTPEESEFNNYELDLIKWLWN